MKPRWTSGPSAESWDSIRAGRRLLCWSRSEAFGPGSIPTGTRFPSSALLPESKRHARTLLGEECLGRRAQGKLITHRAIALKSLLHNRLTVTPREWIVSGRRTDILTLSTFSIHTAKQKQLMGGCASQSYIPIGCRDTSNPPFLLVKLLKALDSFDTTNDKSNKTRLFAVKNCWLANYTFRLVTRNCFDYFIG